MEIPLRSKYRSASTKGISRAKGSGTSGSSKKNRHKGPSVKSTNIPQTRERVLVLVDGCRRSWIWRPVE